MLDLRWTTPLPSLMGLFLAGASPVTASPPVNDLNRNGMVDPYEDGRLPPELRAADLVARMTLEEKAGAMMHGTLPTVGGVAGMSSRGYDLDAVGMLMEKGHLNSFITRLTMPPAAFAEQNNAVQRIARRARLGIPVTISSDPRNHFQAVLGASSAGASFSVWPETLGFAALRDPAVVRRFGEVASREYRAVGIHMALSPQADLATEPRWPRVTATFGSDPVLVSRLAEAYVEGFQHGRDGVARDGVAAVVKHWVGYGAEPGGFDAHNAYGARVDLDEASFARHVTAFRGAFAVHVTGVMPTYPIVTGVTVAGRPLEPVAAGYSRQLVTDLLRGRERFGGLVLSDWGITNDCNERCRAPTAAMPQRPQDIAMPWGVELLSREQRFAKAVNAGLDQFGGVDDPAPLIAAVKAGLIDEARLNAAVERVMIPKFRMGLFEDPFVDAAAAARIVGDPRTQGEADAAQRAAMVLLENRRGFPIRQGSRVWLFGVDSAAARAAGLVPVRTPEQADAAIVRTATPSEQLHPYHFFGSRQHEGRIDLRAGDPGYDAVVKAAARVPTILAVDMDRPAILDGLEERAAALLAVFGASDAALMDVVTGRATPRGRLPFELPRSMVAVESLNRARAASMIDSSTPQALEGLRARLSRRRLGRPSER